MRNVATQQKIILITGASGALGSAAARVLAQAGHHVELGARRIDRLDRLVADIRATGGSAACRAVDVTDADDIQSFVLAAHARHGRVDVLVNGAGTTPPSRVDALKLKEWDRMIDVNLRGVLYGTAAVLPLMQMARGGRIVNLAPCEGMAGGAVLGATGAAVRALSDGLRGEVGDDIRVTIVDADGGASIVARAIADAIGQPARAARSRVRPSFANGAGGSSARPRRWPQPASPR